MFKEIAVGLDRRFDQPAFSLENPEFKVKQFRRYFKFLGDREEEGVLTEQIEVANRLDQMNKPDSPIE